MIDEYGWFCKYRRWTGYFGYPSWTFCLWSTDRVNNTRLITNIHGASSVYIMSVTLISEWPSEPDDILTSVNFLFCLQSAKEALTYSSRLR